MGTVAEAATDATRMVQRGEAGTSAGLFRFVEVFILNLSLGTPEPFFLFRRT